VTGEPFVTMSQVEQLISVQLEPLQDRINSLEALVTPPHSHTPHSHTPHSHTPHSHTPHSHTPHSHSPSDNTFVFGTYDGGHLTINVDVNIPNIKLGFVSYEPATVTLTGPYVNNVVRVIGMGYNAPTLNGLPSSAVGKAYGCCQSSSIYDANGYSHMICLYSGGSSYQGGCNTKTQVLATMANQFGESVDQIHCQYGAYNSAFSLYNSQLKCN